MPKNVCPSCGTRQSGERKACISCGKELNFSDSEKSDHIDRIFHFRPTPFTKAVHLCAHILALLEMILLGLIIVIGHHNIIPFFVPMLVALSAIITVRFPELTYRALCHRRTPFFRHFDTCDCDDPYHKSIVRVFKYAIFEMLLSATLVVVYFSCFEQFTL